MTLSSFYLYLRPITSVYLKGHIGRLTNGLVYTLLDEINPEVALEEHPPEVQQATTEIEDEKDFSLAVPSCTGESVLSSVHHKKHLNGFTVSSLAGRLEREGSKIKVSANETYRLRFTTLRQAVHDTLGTAVIERWLKNHPIIIGESRFQIEKAGIAPVEQDEWVKNDSYEQLWRTTPSHSKLTLRFASPTSFRMGNLDMLFPLPYSVFRSLWEKWNRFAPPSFQLEEEVLSKVSTHVAVSQYDLQTRMVDGDRVKLKGCIGSVTYELQKLEPEIAHALTVLARYALYAGVGKKTPQGMGQVRLESSR